MHYLTTSDNVSLFYRYWPSQQTKAEKAIIIFHRGHEHSGRVQHIVDELNLPDVTMFAWDARGHGQTKGARGYSPSMGTSIRDVDEFVRFIATQYSITMENIVIIDQISLIQRTIILFLIERFFIIDFKYSIPY